MLTTLIVPLQYHFRRWQARRAIAEASAAAGSSKHVRAIEDARKAVHRVEILEARFRQVALSVTTRDKNAENGKAIS